jgi:hypothetical protein
MSVESVAERGIGEPMSMLDPEGAVGLHLYSSSETIHVQVGVHVSAR